jgi:probable rRNA maturation factor
MTQANLQVILRNFQRKWPIDRPFVSSYVSRVWARVPSNKRPDAGATELTIVFLNDRQIRWYNKQFRKKDYPTDVLSFPVGETVANEHYLGDILISMERTAFQAKEKHHPVKRELKILLLHGVLHLLGYDHEADNGQMERLENRLRKVVL